MSTFQRKGACFESTTIININSGHIKIFSMFSSKVITYWCFVSHLAFYPDAVLPFHILRGVFFLLHSAPRSRNLNRINATTGAPANTEADSKESFFACSFFFAVMQNLFVQLLWKRASHHTHLLDTRAHLNTKITLCPTNKSCIHT